MLRISKCYLHRPKYDLIKASTDFELTQHDFGSQTMKHLHRGDINSIIIRAMGGFGGRGSERRNLVGGIGGSVILKGVSQKRMAKNYNFKTMLNEGYGQDGTEIGESQKQQKFNRRRNPDNYVPNDYQSEMQEFQGAKVAKLSAKAKVNTVKGESHWKKGFSIGKDEISDEEFIFLRGFRGQDARNTGLALAGNSTIMNVPLRLFFRESEVFFILTRNWRQYAAETSKC